MSELAIHGGKQAKTKEFPRWPHSDNRELELLREVLDCGKWWRMNGSQVETFERKFAKHHNVEYCLGVTNGTHALELALTTLGITKGDEVIVPAITFISTGSSVIYCNAIPVFVDVDPDTYCMLPEDFERAITPKTKAVIPVYMAGHSCDMDRICAIAKKHNIKVIEDAAHGHGGMYKDRMLGSIGDMAIFSFQNGKIMTCGEGGALVTNDSTLYEKAYLIHGVGRPKNDRVYEYTYLGSNYRMNEFQGAILNAQLERLDVMNQKRETNALLLDACLQTVEGVTPQGRKDYATGITHYMYMFRYAQESFGGLCRNDMVDYLIAEGIPAFRSFPVLSDATFYQKGEFHGRITLPKTYTVNTLGNARDIADHVIWIPHFALLGDEQDIKEIAAAIRKIQACMAK